MQTITQFDSYGGLGVHPILYTLHCFFDGTLTNLWNDFAICNWKPKLARAYSLANLWWQLDVLFNLKSTSSPWTHPTLDILSCAIICAFGLNMSIGYGCDQPHLPHARGSSTQSGFVMHWCPPTPHLASWPQHVGPIFGTKMHVWVALGWVSCPSKECMPNVLNHARAFLKVPSRFFWPCFEREREREIHLCWHEWGTLQTLIIAMSLYVNLSPPKILCNQPSSCWLHGIFLAMHVTWTSTRTWRNCTLRQWALVCNVCSWYKLIIVKISKFH